MPINAQITDKDQVHSCPQSSHLCVGWLGQSAKWLWDLGWQSKNSDGQMIDSDQLFIGVLEYPNAILKFQNGLYF